MKIKGVHPPDFSDKTKWLELEEKREVFFSAAGEILLPIAEKRYYRGAQNGITGVGLGLAFIFFNQKAPLVLWSCPALNNNRLQYVGYIALRVKNGKWAVSGPLTNCVYAEKGGIKLSQISTYPKIKEQVADNPLTNCISIENEGVKILQIDIQPTKVWIILKAGNNWHLREIKKSP